MIKAILACDSKGGIAQNGVMPWPKNKADLAHFSQLTKGHTVIMGRKTWEATDMPSPLPGRQNIVVTRNAGYTAPGACVVTSDIVDYINNTAQHSTVFIIGGASLFKQLIPHITILYLTRIAGDWNCDTRISLNDIEENFQLVEQIKLNQATTFECHFARTLHDLSINTVF